MFHALVYLMAFTGGFTIMSVELLGGRMLAPYFGNSIYVWGSIITVFMLSLSLGYLLGGRLSVQGPTLRRFGVLFLTGAVSLLPIWLFDEAIMRFFFEWDLDPRYGSLTCALALFFVPTTVLGMISPYSVRLLVRSARESGLTAGTLFFVSTLGSALGTLLTSFYLVLWFEMSQIVLTLASATGVCGALAVTWPVNPSPETAPDAPRDVL